MSSDKRLKLVKLILDCIPNSLTLGQRRLTYVDSHTHVEGREVGCRLRILFFLKHLYLYQASILASVFVFCCCVTDFYKLRGLRQYTWMTSISVCQKSRQGIALSPQLGSKSHQAEIKVPAGQHSQLEFRVLFLAHSNC